MDTQPTTTEIVGYHPEGSRHYVTISGFFPKARNIFERLERAFYAFVGHVPVCWAIEKATISKIVARFNVDQARQSGEEGSEILRLDSASLTKELNTPAA